MRAGGVFRRRLQHRLEERTESTHQRGAPEAGIIFVKPLGDDSTGHSDPPPGTRLRQGNPGRLLDPEQAFEGPRDHVQPLDEV